MIKDIHYLFLIFILASCTEVLPEIEPVETAGSTSDFIYLSEAPGPATRLGSVNVADDGSIWASSYEFYYQLKNGKVLTYPIGWQNWGLPFGLYKSGVYFASTFNDDKTLFTSILNDSLAHYELPEGVPDYGGNCNWIELDSLMCLRQAYDAGSEILHFFNEKEWSSHIMKTLPGMGINIGSRYNNILKRNNSTDFIVYNAFHNKEVAFEYTPISGSPLVISENSLAEGGNLYGIQNGNYPDLITFNFNTGIIDSSKIDVQDRLSTSLVTFNDLFLDKHDSLWALGGYWSNSTFYNFVYNFTTNRVFSFTGSTGNSPNLFVDGKGIVWIYHKEDINANYVVYRYENGVLKDTRYIDGNQLAFAKEDNDNNFWFGAWSQVYPYAIDMFCFKDGDYETFNQYFMYKTSNGGYINIP